MFVYIIENELFSTYLKMAAVCLPLDGQGSLLDGLELFAVQPTFDMFLDHDSAIAELFSPQFFHVSHLARAKKQFRLAKLVLVFIIDKFDYNIFTSRSKIGSFDVFGVA